VSCRHAVAARCHEQARALSVNAMCAAVMRVTVAREVACLRRHEQRALLINVTLKMTRHISTRVLYVVRVGEEYSGVVGTLIDATAMSPRDAPPR